MVKMCVKRPFLVFVGVIMVLVLGVVAMVKMKTDLLPSISLPYVEVITTYPGAAPEKVESDVTEVLENSLGTISGVEDVTSISAENYSLVQLEFTEDMDMDAAMARVSRTIDQLSLPDSAAEPIVMEISADMMATMYVGVTKDDMDIYELSDFVDETIIPELKRQEGVASVSTTGAVTKSVEIRLDADKIDEVNDEILRTVNDSLAEAKDKIDEGKAQLEKGKKTIASNQKKLEKEQNKQSTELAKYTKQLNQALATQTAYETQVTTLKAEITALTTERDAYQSNYDQLNATIQGIAASMPDNPMLPQSIEDALSDDTKLTTLQTVLEASGQADATKSITKDNLQALSNGVNSRVPEINSELNNDKTKLATAKAVLKQVKKQVKKAQSQYEAVEQGKITAAAAFGSSSAQLAAAESALEESEQQLEEAEESYKESAKTARDNANLDTLLEMDTLAQLLSAQNFDMPAGYISEDNTQYLLKVGEEYDSMEDLADTVLCKIDKVGDIKLSDVAYVTMIDDSAENYAKIDGNPAVILAVMKSSTAFTSEVSKTCNNAIEQMTEDYDGLQFLNVMDQGDYIDFIVDSVVHNLVVGAILAIFVLLVFLKDWRPTLVIGFSIPLSVLFAIVLMYFTDISFNMISLSGLALGIGMLVDNSIVSIENIYRLRGTGVPAARAAVQGAKQIAAAITASTLTTICVFLPILFTDGLTRELMMDMCLTIGFSLVASLIVALTVVPTMSATLLRNDKSREHGLFDRFVAAYAKLLKLCLRRKAIPLLLAIALLAFSIWQIVRMGIVIIPEMGSEQMEVTVTMPDDTDNTQDAETADAIAEQLSEIEGIKNVGAMASKGTMALLGISGVESDTIKNIEYMIILDEGQGHNNAKIAKQIDAMLADMELEDYTVSESNMDLSSMLGSGLQVNISGKNLDTLLEISEDVADMVEQVGGFEEISNGQEDGDKQISVVVNKDKAARLGLTVAQVYQELAGAVTTEKDATTLTIENKEYTVTIVDDTDELVLDDLMNYEFETTQTDEEGNQTTKSVKLKEFASEKEGQAVNSINRDNQTRYISVTADVADGYNTTLQSRELEKLIDAYDVPSGYSIEIAGESESTDEIVKNMVLMMLLGFIFIYLIMVAQFQSLLSPFIVIFTIPLAFTGGLIGLLVGGEQLSLMSLMGFLILMGVVVNNGIVFVDYVNQLRIEGMGKREALIETGKTRMRPILMTAMTTIFAMATMIFSSDIGSDMSRGMAIVVVGGLLYATLMTLIIVPILYDIMFRRDIRVIDVDM